MITAVAFAHEHQRRQRYVARQLDRIMQGTWQGCGSVTDEAGEAGVEGELEISVGKIFTSYTMHDEPAGFQRNM